MLKLDWLGLGVITDYEMSLIFNSSLSDQLTSKKSPLLA